MWPWSSPFDPCPIAWTDAIEARPIFFLLLLAPPSFSTLLTLSPSFDLHLSLSLQRNSSLTQSHLSMQLFAILTQFYLGLTSNSLQTLFWTPISRSRIPICHSKIPVCLASLDSHWLPLAFSVLFLCSEAPFENICTGENKPVCTFSCFSTNLKLPPLYKFHNHMERDFDIKVLWAVCIHVIRLNVSVSYLFLKSSDLFLFHSLCI